MPGDSVLTPGALSLLADCPLPGCRNQVPADDPGTPCGECLTVFGSLLRPAGAPSPRQSPEEAARVLAERDRAVRAVYSARERGVR